MKRFVSLCLVAVVAFVVFGRATCGKPKPAGVRPVQVMKIKDNVYYHNVSITYGDGKYYTINGGNEDWSVLNIYDKKGRFLDSYDVGLDGRTVFYHPDDELLYVKTCGSELYTVDPEDGEAEIDLEYIFDDENSSPAYSPDGEYVYELIDGEVRVVESFLGEEEGAFDLALYGEEHGYKHAIAASDKFLFTWDEDAEVFVHDLEGEFVTKFKLPKTGFGFSLSWCNGMLWIAEDADAGDDSGDGYWYGYRLDGLE